MKKSGAERLKESKERKRELVRERVKRHREKQRETSRQEKRALADLDSLDNATSSGPSQRRMAKKRAVDRVKESLPTTPEKKVAVISALLESPTTRDQLSAKGLIMTSEAQRQAEINQAIVSDARSLLTAVKGARSKDCRAAVQCATSLLCGENVTEKKLQKDVSKSLSINRDRIAAGIKHRKCVLNDNTVGWTEVKRKRRNDATPEEHLKLACDFWSSPGVSRPTGNKKDVVRERVGPKEYYEHEKQVLEKTQSEVYQEFQTKYPNVKMGQRTFESCKPFFVVPARPADRNSCCCRLHVETRMLFGACMGFRRKVLKNSLEKANDYPVYEHLTDLVDKTLCQKPEGNNHHNKLCCDSQCQNCGVEFFEILPEEKTIDEDGIKVKWQRFEYVNINEKRKLQLVEKLTPPGEMFSYFKSLLAQFPGHRFRANWQHEQMKSLIQCLPFGHVCCVHDYSENYSCQHQDQIQSCYYGQTQASIHVTVLHRHSLKDVDGTESSVDNPNIVTEHIFVISPDLKHDHHSVHECRALVHQYLKGINYPVEFMHEWTDGCSSQYKSRHCMGDISYSLADFGYPTIRNYFETSHAKGPQDGAGANLKFQADMAVIRRQQIVQNAADLFHFGENNLKEPHKKAALSRRVFFYVAEHERNRPRRYFSEIKGNRSIHSILARGQSCELEIRELSCYCDFCLEQDFENCTNKGVINPWDEHVFELEGQERRATRNDVEEARNNMLDLVCKASTVAIASADVGEDYYLLKVISDQPETLRSRTRDDYNASYPAGATVIRGYFYERVACQKSFPNRLFRLIADKTALVYAATVRFICSDLPAHIENGTELFTVLEAEHLDIIDSLDGF